MVKYFFGTIYENELLETNQIEFGVEKVIKRKRDKLYIKRKSYDILLNSWIDKKDMKITERMFS